MALAPNSITAVIPTRGDCDLSAIIRHLNSYPEIDEVVTVIGTTPYNRYLAAETAKRDVIFTQDDDCFTDVRPVIDAYTPGLITNAMTREHAAQYPGRQTLIGFGAIFDKAMLRSLDGWERDALFFRESDRIFATVNPHKTVFPDITILPHAHAPNRLWKQPDHVAARMAMERRIFERTGIVA
jgi:hypothetical protein